MLKLGLLSPRGLCRRETWGKNERLSLSLRVGAESKRPKVTRHSATPLPDPKRQTVRSEGSVLSIKAATLISVFSDDDEPALRFGVLMVALLLEAPDCLLATRKGV